MRCPKCGCEVRIINGMEVCVNCGIVGQEGKEEKDNKPSYVN